MGFCHHFFMLLRLRGKKGSLLAIGMRFTQHNFENYNQFYIQFTLEQLGFEIHRFTYIQIFFNKCDSNTWSVAHWLFKCWTTNMEGQLWDLSISKILISIAGPGTHPSWILRDDCIPFVANLGLVLLVFYYRYTKY